jgi:hypothetical protein
VKQSDHFRENADNCLQLAERATDEATHKRYKRMEAAWRALAQEQDWLDGEVARARIVTNGDARKTPPV